MEVFNREAKEQLGLVALVKGGDEEHKEDVKTFRRPPQLVLESLLATKKHRAGLNKSACEHKARVTKTHTKETKENGEKGRETYGQRKK